MKQKGINEKTLETSGLILKHQFKANGHVAQAGNFEKYLQSLQTVMFSSVCWIRRNLGCITGAQLLNLLHTRVS